MNAKPFFKQCTILAASVALLSACARAELSTPSQAPSQPVINQPVVNQPVVSQPATNQVGNHTAPIPSATGSYTSFSAWKDDFAMRAISQGYDASSIRQLLSGASYNQRTVRLDTNQAEFVKMPWAYVDSAVSGTRVKNGKTNFANHRNLFRQIQSNYGVDAETVAAIWGMESAYGAATGNASIINSLSTLAYDGRRRKFAESQLLALVKLLERGDVRWGRMKGSWAGGMGHTQFIPATWLSQGVDADQNGRANPWARVDALSSTANYLSNSGWQQGVSPFYEAKLPRGFDLNTLGKTHTLTEWMGLGVELYDRSSTIDKNMPLELWLPAGIQGPALLLSKNFRVIKVYNNSSSYALGVSLLGRAIAGKSGLRTPWPRHEKPLKTTQVVRLQRLLTAQGFDTRGADGVIGKNTKKAFARWQAAHGQVADGFITQRSAQRLLNFSN